MRWLVDASVLLAAVDADDPHYVHARRLLAGTAPVATLDLAYYEVTNVAVRAWRDLDAADRLRAIVDALCDDGGIVRVDGPLAAEAAELAEQHGISAYDAAYVAGARIAGAQLVSVDVRDLVGRGLALVPADAHES